MKNEYAKTRGSLCYAGTSNNWTFDAMTFDSSVITEGQIETFRRYADNWDEVVKNNFGLKSIPEELENAVKDEAIKLRHITLMTAEAFSERFGRDIPVHPSSREGWSETAVDVSMSPHFLGWIFALGIGVRILGPTEVAEEFARKMKELEGMYGQV